MRVRLSRALGGAHGRTVTAAFSVNCRRVRVQLQVFRALAG